MNSQMRMKTGLLSRVSTLALLAAAGGLGAVQEAQAACVAPLNVTGPGPITITGTHSCVDAASVTGNVINNATVGAPGDGDAGFFVGKNGILGTLTNNNVITGGGGEGSSVLGALTIAGTNSDVTGGILNKGIISSYSGNGIQLGTGTADGGRYAEMTGTITNSGAITSTLGDGVAAILGSATGGLVNTDDHTISGGNRGIYIADDFTNWDGGISNAGDIQGAAAGIQIGNIGGEGSVLFSGGITNDGSGTISSLTGPTIAVNGSIFSGGINNYGLITQRDTSAAGGEGSYAGVGIVVFAETFNNGIYNTGTIDGLGGPAIWVTSDTSAFNGGIENYGRISGVDNGILIESDEFNGNLINRSSGSITSDAFTGDAIYADTDWTGNFDNQGLIQSGLFGNGFNFEGDSFAGNFTNGDRLFGGKSGSGVVFGNSDTDISDGAEGSAQFRNTGTISGGDFGVRILGDTVAMDFTNDSTNPSLYDPGLISADSGAALLLSAANWTGTITNDGTIRGGSIAMLVGGDFDDGFSANPSNIDRVTTSFTGNITNTGAIIADTESASVGLFVTAGTFTGDIHNTSSGIIRGNETGAYIEANTFDGDIINDGLIEGLGVDTGLHIVTGTHIGNIINNNYGTLSASSNAL
ncbi:MAG: hypothetical protein K8S25_16725, partial [Alphaproteobacteria bacterium]|nr:hypothetical protein [Alphaproteobacteria bacterium]